MCSIVDDCLDLFLDVWFDGSIDLTCFFSCVVWWNKEEMNEPEKQVNGILRHGQGLGSICHVSIRHQPRLRSILMAHTKTSRTCRHGVYMEWSVYIRAAEHMNIQYDYHKGLHGN